MFRETLPKNRMRSDTSRNAKFPWLKERILEWVFHSIKVLKNTVHEWHKSESQDTKIFGVSFGSRTKYSYFLQFLSSLENSSHSLWNAILDLGQNISSFMEHRNDTYNSHLSGAVLQLIFMQCKLQLSINVRLWNLGKIISIYYCHNTQILCKLTYVCTYVPHQA